LGEGFEGDGCVVVGDWGEGGEVGVFDVVGFFDCGDGGWGEEGNCGEPFCDFVVVVVAVRFVGGVGSDSGYGRWNGGDGVGAGVEES